MAKSIHRVQSENERLAFDLRSRSHRPAAAAEPLACDETLSECRERAHAPHPEPGRESEALARLAALETVPVLDGGLFLEKLAATSMQVAAAAPPACEPAGSESMLLRILITYISILVSLQGTRACY